MTIKTNIIIIYGAFCSIYSAVSIGCVCCDEIYSVSQSNSKQIAVKWVKSHINIWNQ